MKEERERMEHFLELNPIALFFKSNEANHEEQEKIHEQLEQANVPFGYIDLFNKQSLIKYLQEDLLHSENIQYPVLKNEKGQYFQGADIKDNNWQKLVNPNVLHPNIDDLIKNTLSSQRIVVFIKGSPEFPECKYTRKIVSYLNSKKVKYGYFNIFTNEELRERLKILSNWKTYPQLYIDGKLIGGNDVIEEMESLG